MKLLKKAYIVHYIQLLTFWGDSHDMLIHTRQNLNLRVESQEVMTYLLHLKCMICEQTFNSQVVQTYCADCNAPLFAQYDLHAIEKSLDRDQIKLRRAGMWRWHELLPVEDLNLIASLGEGDTPIVPLSTLGIRYRNHEIYAKDEGINPTSSFKARGLSAAVSKASELGIKNLAIPTAGNAGGALAAYASRARLKSAVVMPSDTPPIIIQECRLYGADVILLDGLISDCAAVVADMTAKGEWFSVSTFREPYRLEGKKIMGYELAEQFNWLLPDVIIYPTGGGTGLIGIWKAFQELGALGWIEESHLPKMVAVQSDGCAPVVKAFQSGWDHCEYWENARTIASGVRVPHSFADHVILDILKRSGGTAIAVSDEEILDAQVELSISEGIFASPEGAATMAAWKKLLSSNFIASDERVVLFITASGVKYI